MNLSGRKLFFILILATVASCKYDPHDRLVTGPDGNTIAYKVDPSELEFENSRDACDGRKVVLPTITGVILDCKNGDVYRCRNIGRFSTDPRTPGAEYIPCSEFSAHIKGWGHILYSTSSGKWDANWDYTGTGVFFRDECAIQLNEPIPMTLFNDTQTLRVHRDRAITLRLSINGREVYPSFSDPEGETAIIRCPKLTTAD
jgi:hypothetical protein